MMLGYFRAAGLGSRKAKGMRDESLRTALLAAAAPEGGGGEGGEVPKGCFAVYVGEEERRFVVPTSFLCQPAFRALMERAAEEFGFRQAGGLRIPCREADFEAMVRTVEAAQPPPPRRRKNSGGKVKLSPLVKIRL